MMIVMLIAVLIVLGLCLGSFVNALVWRLHQQNKTIKSKGTNAKSLSIVNGRSICPNCSHELAAKDLIPLVSWLILQGKCRYCHKPISIQYPAVELTTTLLFLVSYIYWPFAFDNKGTTLFIFWLAFLVGLTALAVYDIKWYLLPNKIVYFFIGLGVIQALLLILAFNGGLKEIGQIILSFLIGSGLFYALFQISNGKWIGGGDVKLGMLLGLILADPSLSLLMIFIASLVGTAVSLPLLAVNRVKKDSRVPFGPFLIAGTIITRLFGAALIAWYKRQTGLS